MSYIVKRTRKGRNNMNRDELKALELSSEQIEAVMSSYGKSTQDLKSKIDDSTKELEALKKEKSELESKVADTETMKSKIDELEKEKAELSSKISDNELDKQILKVISKDAHDPDDIFKFIDKEQFERDEETGDITNFDEVINAVKESKPYLFNKVDAEDRKQEDSESKKPNNYSTNKQQENKKPEIDYSKQGKALAELIHGKQGGNTNES